MDFVFFFKENWLTNGSNTQKEAAMTRIGVSSFSFSHIFRRRYHCRFNDCFSSGILKKTITQGHKNINNKICYAIDNNNNCVIKNNSLINECGAHFIQGNIKTKYHACIFRTLLMMLMVKGKVQLECHAYMYKKKICI